jgi:hypothetical protein
MQLKLKKRRGKPGEIRNPKKATTNKHELRLIKGIFPKLRALQVSALTAFG